MGSTESEDNDNLVASVSLPTFYKIDSPMNQVGGKIRF